MIVKIRDAHAGESGRRGPDGTQSVRDLHVLTNSSRDNQFTLARDRRLPRVGDRWNLGRDHAPVYVEDVEYRQVTARLWRVRVRYHPLVLEWPTGDPGGGGGPAVVNYQASAVRREVYSHFDLENKPILNSAGQRFSPPPPQYIYNRQIQITWRQSWWNDDGYDRIIGTCNAAAFRLPRFRSQFYPAASVLCNDVQPRTIEADGVIQWEVSGNFEYSREGWRPTRIIDEGTLTLRRDEGSYISPGESDSPYSLPTDFDGVKHGKPVLLDGSGGELRRGAAPQMLEFIMVAEGDFSIFDPITGGFPEPRGRQRWNRPIGELPEIE